MIHAPHACSAGGGAFSRLDSEESVPQYAVGTVQASVPRRKSNKDEKERKIFRPVFRQKW